MPEGDTTTTTTTTAGGEAGANANGDAGNGTPKTFTQDEVDRIVGERLARERKGLGDIDELRRKATEFDRLAEERKTELERAVDAAKKDAEKAVRGEVESTWKSRLVRSEVRAAAAGKLADPEDAVRFLELDKLEVDQEGNLDQKAVAAAIAELLEKKPYLAADGTRRRVDPDAGARTPASGGEDVNTRLRRAAGILT